VGLPLVLRAEDRGLVVETDRGQLKVDASGHALWARAPSGEIWELGASRAGVQAIVDLAARELDVDAEREGATLALAVEAALRRSASHVGKRLGATERAIFRIAETPLVYSARFLDAVYLHEDAARFTPCRVAVASVEGIGADPSPEAADELVDGLRSWRKLYLEGGTPKKTMNRALTIIDDAYDPVSVWGLRRVKLSRTPETRAEIELLGALGAHPRWADLGPHVKMIERTDPALLERALDVVERDMSARVLASSSAAHLAAELLAWISVGPKTQFKRAINTAILQARDAVKNSTPTARPPIDLPRSRAVRFLASFDEIVEEGRVMGHCVATRAQLAVDGRAYIFHVEIGQHRATIQMSATGRIVEARGPGNGQSPACAIGCKLLSDWAAGFEEGKRERQKRAWLLDQASSRESIWQGDRRAPRGAMPIRTARELIAQYERHKDTPGSDAWRGWMEPHLARARAGQAWLIRREVAGAEAIAVLDADGRVVDRWRWT
jgi:hypothetical protein